MPITATAASTMYSFFMSEPPSRACRRSSLLVTLGLLRLGRSRCFPPCRRSSRSQAPAQLLQIGHEPDLAPPVALPNPVPERLALGHPGRDIPGDRHPEAVVE